MNKYGLHGLSTIHVELTNRCNKECWMCGRRKVERDLPHLTLNYGDMEFCLLERIAQQLPPNIVVQLHNNGEPLLYPRLSEAIALFKDQITSFDTNGKLLLEKADQIIGKLDTMAISVIENDPESDEQYEIINKFLEIKADSKPQVIVRLNGNVDSYRYEKLDITIARRVLHAPMGSYDYKKKQPTVPEIGICLDFLHHMAINTEGKVSVCVRFDPERIGVIGNAKEDSLAQIWNGKKRMEWLEYHKQGKRDSVPLCSHCHFWGVPTGADFEHKPFSEAYTLTN
ncbi:MAG: hypothetical protein A3G93_13605 [Nitrospinae bacterium RIFCSPLOWO2_12_FULL_45_22]|nr:MAG: hypothetical protein A3G93_13605 [Nitrospinae bacterium RIFCSPLOWO2_12_FULL_45_22]